MLYYTLGELQTERFFKILLIFSFLFILAFSLIDSYVHPLLFARTLPFPRFASAVVEGLTLFGIGVLLSITFLRLRYLSWSWSEVRTLSMEKLLPFYMLLVVVYFLLLLTFPELPPPDMFSVGTQVIAALFFSFYLLVRNTVFPVVLQMSKKRFEVLLQILIPLVAIEILSTLYINMVSSPTSILLLYVFSWGLAFTITLAMSIAFPLSIAYYVGYRLGLVG